MLFEFIATLALGGGVAGLAMLLRKLSRGHLPKWITPAAAGLGMLAFTIWSEYNWFPRTLAGLGPNAEAVQTVDRSQWWRPWTFAAPVTTRFIAIDPDRTQIKDGTAFTTLFLLSRWQEGLAVPAAFDCAAGLRADQVTGLGDEGALAEANWITVGVDDPALRAACGLPR